MNVKYSITAPTGLGDIIPEPEVGLKSFEVKSKTLTDCDQEAKNFFERFIKNPQNGWDYLRLSRKRQGTADETIDHTGWPTK